MKITTLEEYADFATLDAEKLFRPNHDASLTSKTLITSACLGDLSC
jgi:hypothetical protein